MKKVSYIIALLALIVLPLKVKASATLEYELSKPDANGVYTLQLFEVVSADENFSDFTYRITGQHNLIQTIAGTTEWQLDPTVTTQGTNLTSAVVKTTYVNGIYTGTGQKVKVAEITYVHDPSYEGDDEYKLTIALEGGTSIEKNKKTTDNSKTGSFISYVGIAIGVVLIGAAYIVSRKSTKLYKM